MNCRQLSHCYNAIPMFSLTYNFSVHFRLNPLDASAILHCLIYLHALGFEMNWIACNSHIYSLHYAVLSHFSEIKSCLYISWHALCPFFINVFSPSFCMKYFLTCWSHESHCSKRQWSFLFCFMCMLAVYTSLLHVAMILVPFKYYGEENI